MNDANKGKRQLIRQLEEIRQPMAELNRQVIQTKLVEEELIKSQKRYRNLVELSPDMVALHTHGKYVYVNPAGIKMLRASGPDDLIGKSIFKIIHPDYAGIAQERIGRLRQGKEVPLVEERYVRLDGTVVDVEVAAAPIPFQGEPMVQVIARDITERKRAEEALRKSEEEAKRLVKEAEVLANIGRIISSTLKIEEVYDLFAEEVSKLIPLDRISIGLLNFEAGTIESTYVSGVEVAGRKAGNSYPLAGSIGEEMTRTRKSLLVQTEDPDEIIRNFPRLLSTFQAGLRSMLSVPLISRGQVMGILHIRSFRTNAYTQNDVNLAERVGDQIAGAVANAQLYTERTEAEEAARRSEGEAKRLSRENAIIAEIGRTISSTLNIEEVYERFGEEVRKLIPFDRIAINLIDIQKYTLSINYVLGSPAPHRQLGDVFALGGTAVEEILKTRSSLFIKVQDRDEVAERYPGLWPILNAGYQSIIMIPLISKNEVIGVFNVQSKKADVYDVMGLRFLERVSIQISGAIANAQLFAERRRALDQFMNSEERYRNLVERSPDMILLHNKGKYVYVNPAAVRILGASGPEDLIGKSVFEIIHPDYWKVAKERMARVEGDKAVPLLEEKYIRLDGTSVDVEVMASTIFYQEQPMVQVVARDITERKRGAEKMAALQMQLFQSQKMEAIGQLAGGFAHDFNNSLTLIKTCTQLTLLELKENDPLREKIEMINDAVDRSADLSHHLLAFSRRQVMEMMVLDLNTLLRDLDKMLRRVMGEDVELVYVHGQDLGRVKADPVQIEQVILNLVINARDAMPKGGKLIIETSNIELDEKYTRPHVNVALGRYVLLNVSDTGVGMTPEVRDRVFEPFFTTKPKGKGTGLGLSTAYGIVKQSGGYIWVYSEPGIGSTFKIYLPRVEEPVDEEKGRRIAQELPCGGETLLIVEDEKDLRLMVEEALKKKGYSILEASNGGEALLICEEHKDPIHLMVTDVVMPGMSGPELAQRLRLMHPEMKVLHMSGYAHDAITHHGILEKGVNFIQKPFSLEKLSEKVREALNN